MDISIHEESHVEEILRELVQRFGGNERSEDLKCYLVQRLEEKIANREVLFYELDYTTNHQVDVSVDCGLKRMHGEAVWLSKNQPKLHVYGVST